MNCEADFPNPKIKFVNPKNFKIFQLQKRRMKDGFENFLGLC